MRTGMYWEVLIPKGFVNLSEEPPDLEGLEFYLDAFRELGTCRSNSMSVGPIPFTAIVEYSRLYDVGDFEDFRYIIRAMDRVYLERTKDKPGKQASKKVGKNASKHTGPGNNSKGLGPRVGSAKKANK